MYYITTYKCAVCSLQYRKENKVFYRLSFIVPGSLQIINEDSAVILNIQKKVFQLYCKPSLSFKDLDKKCFD